MVYFTNNKKLNIKINILLAAFLEDEFHDNEICINKINKSFKENIGIWTYIYKNDDGYCHPAIAVNSNNKTVGIFLDKSNFTNKVADVIKNNNAVDCATSINKFINENEKYYDVKNVIEAAIKNNDIDIKKLCESLNL